MIKVLHCITGLTGDGAQRMLLRLADGMRQQGISSAVVSLAPREPLVAEFEERGIHVTCLGMTKGITGFSELRRLRSLLLESKPHIVQGWMYHANVASALAGMTSRNLPVIWNIRRGLDDLSEIKLSTKCVIYGSRVVSAAATKIVYCTPLSAEQHERLGYPRDKRIVIENGFDTGMFHPRIDARLRLRRELQLPDDAILIGNVGRFDPAKGHEFLVEAFARLIFSYPSARLVMVGRGIEATNKNLTRLISRRGLMSRVYLMGERREIEELYSGFDVYCSSSIAEGFPNAVAEAMASGVPCVVTDTGASLELVEGLGRVVPPRSLHHLLDALCQMLAMTPEQRAELGRLSRERIVSRYGLAGVIDRYRRLYCHLLEEPSLREAA